MKHTRSAVCLTTSSLKFKNVVYNVNQGLSFSLKIVQITRIILLIVLTLKIKPTWFRGVKIIYLKIVHQDKLSCPN